MARQRKQVIPAEVLSTEDRERTVASQKEGRDRKQFAKNLDQLTRMYGFSRKEAAEKIEASEEWFRRIVTKGLVRIKADVRDRLEAIAELFRLNRVEDLWRPDLIVFKVEKAGLNPHADNYNQLVWRQEEFSPYAEKLGRLLASGKHEYLKDMIDRLYETLPKDVPLPELGASFWSSGGDDEDDTI